MPKQGHPGPKDSKGPKDDQKYRFAYGNGGFSSARLPQGKSFHESRSQVAANERQRGVDSPPSKRSFATTSR